MFNKLPLVTKGINIPLTEEKIFKFLSNLNWNQPWGAGSHFSHLLFFLNLNYVTKNLSKGDFDSATQFAIDWVNKLQNDNDGTWYKGNTSDRFKINGAMKIISGLNIIDKIKKGDHIRILDKSNNECARGLCSFSSDEIKKILGCHSREIEKILGYIAKSEVVHKDDMVEI